jgi:PIN domain nuclease of toxin-antitoxin system
MTTTTLLDSHVLQWWSAEPDRLSSKALSAIEASDEIAVSAITWFELAWLASRGRIVLDLPVRAWLAQLGADVRTLGITPAVASTAADLPAAFPGDPADRLIYATAIEHGCRLVTKDARLRKHRHPRPLTIW